MRSRPMLVVMLITVPLMVGGLWLATGEGLGSQDTNDPVQARSSKRAERQKNAQQPAPGERNLAFDVSRKDYKAASKYILEITGASGSVSTHDLKKPRHRRGTITVPLPVLPPGKYDVVVVAEGRAGKSRSAPLQVEIR